MADDPYVNSEVRRLQLREAKQRQRARQRAEARNEAHPPEAALQRAARYHPPSVRGVVARASADAASLRERRAATLGSLRSVRNPLTGVYVPPESGRAPGPEPKTAAGRRSAARAIRASENGKRVADIGRARREELQRRFSSESETGLLHTRLTGELLARYEALVARITDRRVSNQALGILFNYEGGAGRWNAFHDLLYSSIEEAFDQLEALAAEAEAAAQLYKPSRVGTIRV